MPGDPCFYPCCGRELHLIPGCAGQDSSSCVSDGDRLSIPKQFLKEANIPDGQDVTVMAADGALLIVTVQDELEDLPLELCALLNELGISPINVRGLLGEEWSWM